MKEFVEKLIGRLENRIKYNELCHKEFPNAKMSLTYEVQINAYKNAIEIVKELAEEYNNGWIACSERLPENYTEVLGCDYEGNITVVELYVDNVFGKVWKQWNGGNLKFNVIIAWMPLPAPYQKGE